MKKSLTRGLIACLSVVSLAACQDYDAGFSSEEINQGLYAKDFEKTFGEIDPNQDWNAAGRYTASINLTGISKSKCDVLIYNGNPLGGGELAAHYLVDGKKDFDLDLPKNIAQAYVVIVDTEGNALLQQYVDIVDGVILVSRPLTRAASDPVPAITLREVPQSGTTGLNDFNRPLNPTAEHQIDYNYSVYYLDNESAVKNGSVVNLVKDMATIVVGDKAGYVEYDYYTPAGFHYKLHYDNGYFAEGVDNRELYKDKFSRDVILTTKGGELTIANEFGGTDYTNQFGYYYYKEGATPEETLRNKVNAKKYIAINRSEPGNNIVLQRESKSFSDEHLSTIESKSYGGMALPNQVIPGVMGKGNGWSDNDRIIGTKYRLVYFEDGKDPSYDFPAGLKVGFFYKTIMNSYIYDEDKDEVSDRFYDTYINGEKNGTNIRFSDSELNGYYGFTRELNGETVGDWKAVTYSLKTVSEVTDPDGTKRIITTKRVIAGFEDGTDNDLNDMMFHVEGILEEEVPDVEIKSDKQAWVIASEDLGGSFDYDFNDVVFCVKHTSGENVAKIVPYASSGTLPVYVYYTDKDGVSQKLGNAEFHSLVKPGAPSDTQINGNSREEGAEIEITVPSTFSLSYDEYGHSNMGGFDVKVDRAGNGTEVGSGENVITGKGPEKGKSPQMLLIHDINFAWPTEGTYIVDAYPMFANYVSNAKDYCSKWYEAGILDNCVARGNHSIITETQNPGGSGSGSGGTVGPAWLIAPIINVTQSKDVVFAGDEQFTLNISFGAQNNGNGGMTAFGDGSKISYTIDNPELFTNVSYAQYGESNKPTIYLTPVKAGVATFTITHAGDGVSYKESSTQFTVTVYSHSDLAATPLTLGCGKTYTLIKGTDFTTSCDGAITVTSNNTSVATVDGFTITTGNVDIITTVDLTISQAESSDHLYPAAYTTLRLTVDPDAKDAATLRVTKSATVDLVAKGDAGTITKGTDFNFDLGASNLGVTYSSSNEAVMTVSESNGVVTITPKSKGTAEVRITSDSDDTYAGITLSVATVNVEKAPTTTMAIGTPYELDFSSTSEDLTSMWCNQGFWVDLSSYSLPEGASNAAITLTFSNAGNNILFLSKEKTNVKQFSGWAGSPHTETFDVTSLFSGEGFYIGFGGTGMTLSKVEMTVTE